MTSKVPEAFHQNAIEVAASTRPPGEEKPLDTAKPLVPSDIPDPNSLPDAEIPDPASLPDAEVPSPDKLPDAEPTKEQHEENASVAAANSTNHTQDEALKLVADYGNEVSKFNKKREDLAETYKRSPGLTSWVAQDPQRRPALLQYDDATYLSALERWFLGPLMVRPPSQSEIDYARANGLPINLNPERRETGHGLLVGAMLEGIKGTTAKLETGWNDLMDMLQKHPGPQSADEKDATFHRANDLFGAVQEYQQAQNAQHLLGSENNFGTRFATGFVGTLPTLVPLAFAPQAAAPLFFADSYGALRMAGVDEGWALAGALPAALIPMILHQSVPPGGMAGAEDVVQKSLSKKITSLYLDPAVLKLAKSLDRHATSGFLSAVGMGMASEAAVLMDRYNKTGQKPDVSEVMERFNKITESALTTLPLGIAGGWKEYREQQGMLVAAHGDQASLAAATNLVKALDIAERDPNTAKDILRHLISMRQSQQVLDNSARSGEIGANVADAQRARMRAFVTAPAFARAAKKMGMAPEELIRKVTQTDPQSFSDAEIMGIPIRINMEDFLVDLKDAHKQLLPGTSLGEDRPSLEEVQAQEPVKAPFQIGPQRMSGKPGGPPILEPFNAPKEKNAETQESPVIQPEQLASPEAQARVASFNAPADAEGAPEPYVIPAPNYDAVAKEKVAAMQIGQLETKAFSRAAKTARKAEEAAGAKADTKGMEEGTAARVLNERMEAQRKAALKRAEVATAGIKGLLKEDHLFTHPDEEGATALGVHKAIADVLSGKTVADWKAKLQDARDAGYQIPDSMADFFQNPRRLPSLKLSEAEDLHLTLKSLKNQVTNSLMTYVGGTRQPRKGVIQQMLNPPPGGVPPGPTASLINLLGPTRAGKLLQGDADLSNFMTLYQPWGPWGEEMPSRRITARNNESLIYDQIDKAGVGKLTGAVKARANEDIQWPQNMQNPYTRPAKRKDALRTLTMTGTEEGLENLTKSWGVTPADLHHWLFNQVGITKEEMDFVSKHWEAGKSLGDLADAAVSNATGTPMKRQTPRTITAHGQQYTGGFSPFRWESESGAPPVRRPGSADSNGPGAFRMAYEEASGAADPTTGAVPSRGGPTDRPDVSWDNIMPHYRAMAHFVSHYDFVNELHTMLSDTRFQKLVLANKGDAWFRRMKDSYELMIDGQQAPTDTNIYVRSLILPLKRVAQGAAFNLNFPVTLGTSTHGLIAAANTPAGYTGMAKGLVKMVTGDGWKFAGDNSEVAQYRHRNSFQEVRKHLNEIAGTNPSWRDYLDLPGHTINEAMDTFLTRWVFNGNYHRLLPELGHQEAVKQADLETEKMMPARSALDQSAVARDTTLGLHLLTRNFNNTIWNINAMDQWETRAQINGGQESFFKGAGMMSLRRIGQVAGLGVGMYLMGHGQQQDEREDADNGWKRTFFRSLLTETTYGNILTHEVMRTFGGVMTGGKFNPWSVHILESVPASGIPAAIRDLGKIFSDTGYGDKTVAALDGLGRTLGMSVGRTARGIHATSQLSWKDIHNDFEMMGQAFSQPFYGVRPESTPITDAFRFHHWLTTPSKGQKQ